MEINKNALHRLGSSRIQDLFTNIAKSITSSLELSKVTEAIMEQVETFFQPNNWSMLRIDDSTQELFFFVAKGIDANLANNIRFKLGEGIAGWVAKSGESVIIDDAQHDSRFSNKVDNISGFNTHSLIAVPIKFQNRILGVIEIVNAVNQRDFTQQELSILETIADFSAIALTNSIAHEIVTWNSIHDSLTGTYNRVQLNKLIKQCHARFHANNYKRKADTLYIIAIWIDIDKFKEVNDCHGHTAGDKILIKTANILKTYCRNNDFIFRMGGDEFLIAIMDLHEQDVQIILDRIQSKLQIDSHDGLGDKVGFSYGIAHGLKTDFQELIKTADNNMYLNKAKSKKPQQTI